MFWEIGSHRWALGGDPLLMGILNVTPDSFSDGYPSLSEALAQGLGLIEEGADIIDIGGESTRPGSKGISAAEECQRILPVIKALRRETDIPISVDTQKAEVAIAALDAGVNIVNHVSASLDYEKMLPVIARYGAGYVAMHMRERPKTMQKNPTYVDPVAEVTAALAVVARAATLHGVSGSQIVFDPGIGFGKRLEDNLALMRSLQAMKAAWGRPLLLGISRKSWLVKLLGPAIDEHDERDAHTAIATILLNQPAVICHRLHQVGLLKRALRLAKSLSCDDQSGLS